MHKSSPCLFLAVLLILFSCKTDTPVTESRLSQLESELQSNPSRETANKLVQELSSQISSNRDDKGKVKELLLKGYSVAKDNNLTLSQVSFLNPLVREFPKDAETKSRLLDLAGIMKSVGKEHTSQVIYSNLVNLDKDNQELKNAAGELYVEDVNGLLKKLAESVFEDPDQFGINRINSQKYVDACEAYVLSNPGADNAAETLYKASEIARSLKTIPKALSIYDWIIDSYPNYEKTPTAYFLKGFILDDQLKNDSLAGIIYTEFLEKFPDDELADDVEFLKSNLGKSNEEILKIIQKGGEN